MKVFSCPAEVPEPQPDYKNYDRVKEQQAEDAHLEALKAWLVSKGYTGKHTGATVRFQVADGYAQYMLADGKSPCLIHLPYGDAYQYRDVQFLPKAEILHRIEREKAWSKLFQGHGSLKTATA
jgi:hypothetical protein